MKFESRILIALFAVCFGACAFVMGAMLVSAPAPLQLARAGRAATAVALLAPTRCALPADNATCPRGND